MKHPFLCLALLAVQTTALAQTTVAGQAPPKPVVRYKAGQDTAFRHGSGIALDNLTKLQIDNLAVLGRVWGFVKYYHPTVAQLKNTKGLVIDIRNYPAEFVVFALTQYLSAKPVPFAWCSEPRPTYPGVFVRTPAEVVQGTKEAPYAGKLMILVNELSQSQAEYTAMALRAVPGAKVVGSTTAGADGNVSDIILPGNISTLISGLGVYYPDGREIQRVGIVPDVVVKPTIAGIRAGHDEVLEKAVQLIEAK